MIKRMGIVGAGAVGCSLGSLFHLKYGNDFCFVAKGTRAERIRRKGISVNGKMLHPNVYSGEDSKTLDLIILCVKNYSLEEVIEELMSFNLSQETIILPLLNGVTAVDRVRAAFPNNPVPYGIVMRTDAERIGENVTVSIHGEIQIGFGKGDINTINLNEIKSVFSEAGIRAVIYDDMRYMLWRKWMINIGSNQVSVLTGAKFKYFGQFEEISILVKAAIQEILDISLNMGIGLTENDRDEIIQILINYPPEKKTSMLQDIEAKRKTEIDYFAGTVMELGLKTGVPTPVNRVLYYAIKAREKVGLAEREIKN